MKKIISFILSVLMLVSAFPVLALADGADAAEFANPFTDVKEGKWYYDAVMWCREKGYMEGDSETTFAPSKEMTRSMLVTVLAAIAGVDTSAQEYQQSPFVDVAEGKWYTGAIVWANENGIANGISDDTFGYKNAITRETLVLMVYGFMKYMGVDVSDAGENVYNSFGDTDRVHDWAVDAVKWAVANEIISGTGSVNGSLQISPRATATRAQVAVIVKAMLSKNLGGEYPVGSFTLGGSDISEFTIVCGKTFTDEEENAAREIGEHLAEAIANACGVRIPVVNDDELEAVEGAKEILIGKTNREDAGLVSVERNTDIVHDIHYEMQGSYLIIASDELDRDTYLSASRFLEDVLGVKYYGSDIFSYESKKSASLEDGVKVTDTAYLDSASSIQGEDDSNPFLTINDEWKTLNANHNLPTLACSGCEGGDLPTWSHHEYHYLGQNPCLSDPDVIDTIIKNVRYILEEKLGENKDMDRYVYVNQDDSGTYCRCEHCGDITRLWGRAASYVQIMYFVGEAFKDEYPNVKFIAYSCDHTKKAPKTADEISDEDYAEFLEKYGDLKYVPAKEITVPDNCELHIKTDDTGCTSHRRDDPNCERNVDYNERVRGWTKFYDHICMLNFSGSKMYCNNPLPTIYQFWDDFNYFSQFEQFISTRHYSFNGGDSADFAGLMTYLNSRLFWDSDMTWDEYSAHINAYLKTVYGPGWAYVREYIDTYEKLSRENHWWTYSATSTNTWDRIITEEQWRSNGNFEYCTALLEKALELCETDAQYLQTEKIKLQMDYIECVLTYRTYKATRDQADLDKFVELNNEYRNNLEKHGLWVPDNWTEKGDPDKWTTEQ